MLNGTPVASGDAQDSGSPSAPANSARSALTVTVAARVMPTWAKRVCLPRLAISITRTKENFGPPLTVTTSSRPSVTSASGAAGMPPAK